MIDTLDAVLARSGRVGTRSTLVAAIGRPAFDREVRRGHLVAVFPRTYCRPWDADLPSTRRRGALMSVGRPAALSHDTALALDDLRPSPDRIDVLVPASRRITTGAAGLAVRRTRTATAVRTVDGLAVVTRPVALIQHWAATGGAVARAPAIEAVRRRLVTPAELDAELDTRRTVPRREELRALIAQLTAGCDSELELHGFIRVFALPALRHGRRQYVLRVAGRTVRLDLAFVAQRVAVELDGRAYHSSHSDRERDLRRDAALAAAGWVTVRFSYARLHADPDGCVRDLTAVLAARTR